MKYPPTTTPPKDAPPRNDYLRDEAETKLQLKSLDRMIEEYHSRRASPND